IRTSSYVAQTSVNHFAAGGGACNCHGARCGGFGGLLGVQAFLAQYSRVQHCEGGTRVAAQIFGPYRFESPISVESGGLALSNVIGGDQLRPERFMVRMRAG